jgi:hypothetical protein
MIGLPTQPNLDRHVANLGIHAKLFDCFKLKLHLASPAQWKVREAPDQNLTTVGRN